MTPTATLMTPDEADKVAASVLDDGIEAAHDMWRAATRRRDVHELVGFPFGIGALWALGSGALGTTCFLAAVAVTHSVFLRSMYANRARLCLFAYDRLIAKRVFLASEFSALIQRILREHGGA